MQRGLSPDHGSEVSVLKAGTHCSLRDSLETRENSVIKFRAPSKLVVSPLLPRKLDFESCVEPVSDSIRPVRRGRTHVYAHQEKRFKGLERVVPHVLLELFDAGTGEGHFFRCYKDEAIGADRSLDLPEGQEDDCDTDEETAQTMQQSLASALEEAIESSVGNSPL